MNRATPSTGWVRNPIMKSPELDPRLASSYELGWTSNPLTGCLYHTNGLCNGGGFPCYAYKLANGRLRERYLANKNVAPRKILTRILPRYVPFYPRFWEDRECSPITFRKPRNPKGIFVCDMGELFGDWIPRQWQHHIFATIMACPQHRFYLLTKQPQNLIKFSPFPPNCYVGVTVTDGNTDAGSYLSAITATVRFISFKPLLHWGMYGVDKTAEALKRARVGWVIIGACTGTKKDLIELNKKYPELTLMPYGNKWTLQPKVAWVEEIVRACDKAGVPVFLKDNLLGMDLPHNETLFPSVGGTGLYRHLRQEIPEVMKNGNTQHR